MKRTVLFAVGLIILLIVLNALLDYGLRVSPRHHWNNIRNGSANADVVFMGSSRCLVHFDAPYIQGETGLLAYNLGMNGTHLEHQLPAMKMYLNHHYAPKVWIQSLDFFTLQNRHSIFNPLQYTLVLDDPNLYESVLEKDADFWKHRWVPMYKYAVFGPRLTAIAVKGLLWKAGFIQENRLDDLSIYTMITKGWAKKRTQGFVPVDIPWTGEFEQHQKTHPSGFSTKLELDALDKLEEMVALASEHDIKLVLVYPPEYHLNYQRVKNRSEIMDVYKAFAAKHRLEFWDYSGADITLEKSNFYNSQHLNAEAARRFSHDISKRLKSAGLLE